jgi:hypothetical protein
MFFVIQSTNPRLDLKTHRTKRTARKAILLYQLGATELMLDNYLKKEHQVSLRVACLRIIQNMTFALNMQKEIIAKIPDEDLNKIARIITYGTGKIPGSQILRKVIEIK